MSWFFIRMNRHIARIDERINDNIFQKNYTLSTILEQYYWTRVWLKEFYYENMTEYEQ